MDHQKLDDQELNQVSGGAGESIPDEVRTQIEMSATDSYKLGYSISQAVSRIMFRGTNAQLSEQEVYNIVSALYDENNRALREFYYNNK